MIFSPSASAFSLLFLSMEIGAEDADRRHGRVIGPLVVLPLHDRLPAAEARVAGHAVRVGHPVDPGLGALEGGLRDLEARDLGAIERHDAPARHRGVARAAARGVAPAEAVVLSRVNEGDRLLGRLAVGDGVREPVGLRQGERGDRVVVDSSPTCMPTTPSALWREMSQARPFLITSP